MIKNAAVFSSAYLIIFEGKQMCAISFFFGISVTTTVCIYLSQNHCKICNKNTASLLSFGLHHWHPTYIIFCSHMCEKRPFFVPYIRVLHWRTLFKVAKSPLHHTCFSPARITSNSFPNYDDREKTSSFFVVLSLFFLFFPAKINYVFLFFFLILDFRTACSRPSPPCNSRPWNEGGNSVINV